MSVFGTTNTEWVERNRVNVTQIEVPVVRFQDHLRRTGTPYFVKIDIEGDDGLCLDALLALEARPALLSLESDKTDFDQLRSTAGRPGPRSNASTERSFVATGCSRAIH